MICWSETVFRITGRLGVWTQEEYWWQTGIRSWEFRCLCSEMLRSENQKLVCSSAGPSSLVLCPEVPPTSPRVPPGSSVPPLLSVCYSCWSNLENVPNPLSVLLPQHNTKWIRQDYCLPLPPSCPLPLHPCCHSLLIISKLVCLCFSGHVSFHRQD